MKDFTYPYQHATFEDAVRAQEDRVARHKHASRLSADPEPQPGDFADSITYAAVHGEWEARQREGSRLLRYQFDGTGEGETR